LKEADERLTGCGNAISKRTAVYPGRARVLIQRFGIVEDQLTAGWEAADRTHRYLDGFSREVRNSAQPNEERTLGEVEPAFGKRVKQRRFLQINWEEAQGFRCRHPGARELLALPFLSCRMVDLNDVEAFLERAPIGECIETGSKNDQLTDAALPYSFGERGFCEFASSSDEEAKGAILRPVLGSLSKLLDRPAEDCDR
jgi:hypothetical protein